MRKILATMAVLGLASATVQAAPTLTLALGVSFSNNAPTTAVSSLTIPSTGSSTVYVYLFGQTNTLQDPASNTSIDNGGDDFSDETANDDASGTPQTAAGGIRSVEFNVTNAMATCTTVKFSNTITSNGFGTINGTKSAGAELGYDFSDTESYDDTVIGTADSTTLNTTGAFAGFDELAVETWTVSASSTFTPSTTGLSYYYDSTNGAQNFDTSYLPTNINELNAGVVVASVPEPASLSLLGLGALSFAARRRRA